MVKSFLGLFSNHCHKERHLVIRYEDIPKHSKMGLIHESYPQVIGIPLTPRPPDFFCQRYADELHGFFNRLALRKEEVDRLLMPLLTRLIDFVNVLPASENHHHSGVCGLFVHSIQCASASVTVAERSLQGTGATLSQRYRNRPRWLLAAGVMGLIHDVGKIFDIEVVAENGNKWDPFSNSLWAWTAQAGIKQVFVLWRPNRVHKQHELRSIRLVYSRLITNDLMSYLSAVSGDALLGAIDDAIVFGSGPLGEILKEADAESIRQDGEKRRVLGATYTQSASPLVTPILSAMGKLIESGLWSVNKNDSPVYVTRQGLFVRLNQVLASDVYREAVKLRAPYVPGTPEGLVRVLQEQNLIETPPCEGNSPSPYWHVTIDKESRQEQACIKFCDLMVLFAGRKLPTPIDVVICNANKRALEGGSTSVPQKAKLQFIAPQTDFLQAPSPRETKKASQQVTQAECDEIPQEALKPQQAKVFVERMLATVVEQMRAGKGFLIEELVLHDDGRRVCSSRKVESILEMHKIGQKTHEMLIRLISSGFRLDFDPNDHSFSFNFDKDETNEKSKSCLSTGT